MFFLLVMFLFFMNSSSVDYNTYCWILNANFNYLKPRESMLNLAYPASIAYYFITIVPPNSNYSFQGEFLKENIYELSLTVYDSDGIIDTDFQSVNTFNSKGYIDYNVLNNHFDVLYVLQRFYINLNIYDEDDMIDNLFQVYDNKNDFYLTFLTKEKRDYYSEMIYKPLQTLISWIAPNSNKTFSEFSLKGDFTGLFPDTNHYYLSCAPGLFVLFEVSGYFLPSNEFPYIDFITVNQKSVSTDNGIPFYEFLKKNNTYKIYVSTHDVQDKTIYNIDPNAIILKWDKDNHDKVLIFRIIDYTNIGIANATGPLTPQESKKMMKKFYPEIVPIEI